MSLAETGSGPGAAEAPLSLPDAVRPLARIAFRAGACSTGSRDIAEEVAVALTYGGGTHAVMMATPADLEDFAVGFSLTERIVARAEDIGSIAVVPAADGIDIQMWLAEPRLQALAARRRQLAGPTGCGLCGVDSLAEAIRRPSPVGDGLRLDSRAIADAVASLAGGQALHRRTGAVHAAAFWRQSEGIVCLREDVGRHNALDKLVGALARRGEAGRGGVLLLTSRVSVEMVQKAAVLGAEIVVAVSAPTALAIRVAEAAGITLLAIARADGFEVFAHPHRIADAVPSPRIAEVRRPLMQVEDALAVVLAGVEPIAGDERVPLLYAVGRVAAEGIATPLPLPGFDHSAMDGYGIAAADCGRSPPFRLRLAGRVLAGAPAALSVGPGETARLLTGAPIPAGVAAVIMEEHCGVADGMVEIRREVATGLNIRRQGEDAPSGSAIITPGAAFGFQHVPVLAACGIESVLVRRRLRVAILSTGDELAAAGGPLGPATIRDANGAMLKALLARPWIEIDDLGIVGDDLLQIRDRLQQTATADLVITSGGVSGGDADHLLAALAAAGGRGQVLRLALKPGKPLLVGAIGDIPLLGLPGNPLSALANMLLFGRALLRRRAGRRPASEWGAPALLAAPLHRKPGRTEIIPAEITGRDPEGLPLIALAARRGSARLHALASASGLAIIPAEAETLGRGDLVPFVPFGDLWKETETV